MAIKLKYDLDADRMRLTIQQEGQPERCFWLRRNQCLSVLARLSDVLQQLGVEATPVEPLTTPPPVPKKKPEADAVEPEMLTAVRMRLEGETLRLTFVHPEHGVGFAVKAPGAQRLHEMLATQAERAGWDPTAGVARLKAMAQVRATIARMVKPS